MTFDYYVRISESRLQGLRLVHLESGVDLSEGDEVSDRSQSDAVESQLTGYTEWLAESAPEISVGWDWMLSGPLGKLTVRETSIRTNVMLVDESGADLGHEATIHAWSRLLSDDAWHATVLDTLNRLSNESLCKGLRQDFNG